MCDLGWGHSSALVLGFQIQPLIQDEKSVKIDFFVSCIQIFRAFPINVCLHIFTATVIG